MHTAGAADAGAESIISPRSPLIFMHNPKTGGMSLFTAFSAVWGTSITDLYNVSTRNAELALQAAQDPTKAVYCGHYAFGLHEWLGRPAYYASVLREPVARIASLYHYCQPMLTTYRQRLQQLGGDMALLATQPNISDFYLDFEPWLTGTPDAESFFASPCAELDNGMVRRFSGYGLAASPCPDTALEQAKRNLEQYFSVVGLLERYPETLGLMARTFSLPALNVNHVNANSKTAAEAPLGDAVLQKIRDMNRLDLAFYAWVAERFERQLAEPREAVRVPGGARTDMGSMPLWRAVGQSPLRVAAMRQKGVPKRPVPTHAVLCNRITGSSVSAKAVMTDIETALIRKDQPPQKGPLTRLVFEPAMARRMVAALNAAIEAHEREHGDHRSGG